MTANCINTSTPLGITSVASGGTGQASAFTAGGAIYGLTTSALACTGIGGVGQPLISGNTAAPAFQALTQQIYGGSGCYTLVASTPTISASVGSGTGTIIFNYTLGTNLATILTTGSTVTPSGYGLIIDNPGVLVNLTTVGGFSTLSLGLGTDSSGNTPVTYTLTSSAVASALVFPSIVGSIASIKAGTTATPTVVTLTLTYAGVTTSTLGVYSYANAITARIGFVDA